MIEVILSILSNKIFSYEKHLLLSCSHFSCICNCKRSVFIKSRDFIRSPIFFHTQTYKLKGSIPTAPFFYILPLFVTLIFMMYMISLIKLITCRYFNKNNVYSCIKICGIIKIILICVPVQQKL